MTEFKRDTTLTQFELIWPCKKTTGACTNEGGKQIH